MPLCPETTAAQNAGGSAPTSTGSVSPGPRLRVRTTCKRCCGRLSPKQHSAAPAPVALTDQVLWAPRRGLDVRRMCESHADPHMGDVAIRDLGTRGGAGSNPCGYQGTTVLSCHDYTLNFIDKDLTETCSSPVPRALSHARTGLVLPFRPLQKLCRRQAPGFLALRRVYLLLRTLASGSQSPSPQTSASQPWLWSESPGEC